MNAMTVLYDPNCPICVRARQWFAAQPTCFPVSFVPQGSAAAGHRFPQLHVGQGQPVEDLIVVADDGKVYRSTRAWIMCFYALRQYRPLAFRLSHPALMPLARRAYHAVSTNRMWLGRVFGSRAPKITNQQLVNHIKTHSAPTNDGCHLPTPGSRHPNPPTDNSAIDPDNLTACVIRNLNQKRARRAGEATP